MNGKITLASIFLILIIATATFAFAAFILEYVYPNIGTISTYGLEMWLDPDTTDAIPATKYPDGTSIDWGPLQAGATYQYDSMLVKNVGNTALIVTIQTYGLPFGWTITWTGNGNTIQPGAERDGILSITVPVGATQWPSDCGFYLHGE